MVVLTKGSFLAHAADWSDTQPSWHPHGRLYCRAFFPGQPMSVLRQNSLQAKHIGVPPVQCSRGSKPPPMCTAPCDGSHQCFLDRYQQASPLYAAQSFYFRHTNGLQKTPSHTSHTTSTALATDATYLLTGTPDFEQGCFHTDWPSTTPSPIHPMQQICWQGMPEVAQGCFHAALHVSRCWTEVEQIHTQVSSQVSSEVCSKVCSKVRSKAPGWFSRKYVVRPEPPQTWHMRPALVSEAH